MRESLKVERFITAPTAYNLREKHVFLLLQQESIQSTDINQVKGARFPLYCFNGS